MKKIMLVFGTRPEAIKMCPVVKELQSRPRVFETVVCVTGQHREMLDQVLKAFHVLPDRDLSIMQPGQSLFDITNRTLRGMEDVLLEDRPDMVLVHGDTSTSFASALACFYSHTPVGHVEAGLRTRNLQSPWPEEFNRQAVDMISNLCFAPTPLARENLLLDQKDPSDIFVTGNTGIDALRTTVSEDYRHPLLSWANGSRLVLMTAHRRENVGETMRRMFRAVRHVVERHNDVKVVYPVHMNPSVREAARSELSDCDRVKLIEPLGVIDFHNILARSYMVLTDSGGIQEEAPGLGKPVLVMRDTTERPEGVRAGTLKLVGTNEKTIIDEFSLLLDDVNAYRKMSEASNPYGDGFASKRIADTLEERA